MNAETLVQGCCQDSCVDTPGMYLQRPAHPPSSERHFLRGELRIALSLPITEGNDSCGTLPAIARLPPNFNSFGYLPARGLGYSGTVPDADVHFPVDQTTLNPCRASRTSVMELVVCKGSRAECWPYGFGRIGHETGVAGDQSCHCSYTILCIVVSVDETLSS